MAVKQVAMEANQRTVQLYSCATGWQLRGVGMKQLKVFCIGAVLFALWMML